MTPPRMLLLAAALLVTSGCGEKLVVEFPTLPDLSEETRRACPPAPAVTGELGDLVAKDAALAIEYARCQGRHATAVGAYETAQRLLRASGDAAKAREGKR